jgi:hypothetical protein
MDYGIEVELLVPSLLRYSGLYSLKGIANGHTCSNALRHISTVAGLVVVVSALFSPAPE